MGLPRQTGEHEAYVRLECSERKAKRKGTSFPQTRESMRKLISLRDSVLTDSLLRKEFFSFLQKKKNYKWGPWDKATTYPTDGSKQQWYHHDNSALMFQTWARCFFISVFSSQRGIKSSIENIEKSWVLPLILWTPHSHYYHWFSWFQCFVHRGEPKDFNFQILPSNVFAKTQDSAQQTKTHATRKTLLKCTTSYIRILPLLRVCPEWLCFCCKLLKRQKL